jgi:hypothetical protein
VRSFSVKYLLFLLTVFSTVLCSCKQRQAVPDSEITRIGPDAKIRMSDSSAVKALPDTLNSGDTSLVNLKVGPPDSLSADTAKPPKPSPLEEPVIYKAMDSLVFDAKNMRMYLYDSCVINYQAIELKAARIQIDLKASQLHAEGGLDTLSAPYGKPVFKENEDEFMATTLDYNFKSKRGLIRDAVTNEGDIWLHGSLAKKQADDVLYIKHARFTTCSDPDHPHFDIATNKAKLIPEDKVVTGPAVLRINGVPTPLALPFGFFPNQTTRSSGILLPEYGEQQRFGFFLRNFGYYLNLSDEYDLMLLGDIFTSLSFGVRSEFRYNRLYKHDGNFALKFSQFQAGDPAVTEDFERARDFSIVWTHNQSPKAHPTFNFQSNVNIQTGGFNRLNAANVGAIVQNQFSSNINFTKRFAGTPINLSGGLRHFQNTATGQVTLSLPEMVFNVNRFNPFRRKTAMGSPRWYENIGVTYRMQLGNQVNTIDTMLTRDPLRELANANTGIRHEIAANTNLTLLKYLFLTPSIRYDERWSLRSLQKSFDPVTQSINDDTLRGFNSTRQLDFSTSFTTNVFSTIYFKSGRLKGLRHTLTPNVTLLYRPDLGDHVTGFYGVGGQFITYSPSQIGLYGSVPQGQSGQVNMSFQNRVEAKVGPGRRDSIFEDKRVPIIEQLTVNTAYDMARDSLRWSNLTIGGRTTLFKNLGINLDMSLDPYAFKNVNGQNVRVNRFEWGENGRPFRLTTMGLAVTYGIRGNSKRSSEAEKNLTESERRMLNDPFFTRYFVDFNVPYSFNINYNIRYNRPFDVAQNTHTIGISGDVNLTPKWKFAFNLNYDLENGEVATSSFDVFRDLHCWEMRFSVIPFGFRQSYSFTINVKSSILQALRLNRQQGWFNN